VTAPIEFLFDFSSPYGYIAACRIDAIAAKHGRAVDWRPFMLGATFRVTGAQPLTQYPLKGAYSTMDFARSARRYGIPFQMPARFPLPTVLAARCFYVVAEADGDRAREYALAIYRAYFVEGRDISDPAVVAEVLAVQGLDAAAMIEAAGNPEIKAKLKAITDEAVEKRGVFGSPFIFVDGEPFWGADRLEMIDEWLRRGGW